MNSQGQRVVLTTGSNLCYAGLSKGLVDIDGKQGLMVELDKKSGFCIWCPDYYIKNLTIIPIPDDTSSG